MHLLVFLAFCVGLATASHVNEIQIAEPADPLNFVADDHCACTKEPVPQCGCCYEFKFQQKQHKICTNITSVKDEKALRFTVILDGKVLLNETLSAKNPPAFCQGIKPLAYICVKYSNMSYGDDSKWGGCLEIYGGVVIKIIDLDFGCFYLPVNTQQVWKKTVKKPNVPSVMNRFLRFSKGAIVNELQQWYERKERQEKSKGNLKNILFKNRVDDEENEGIEIPDIN